MAACLVTTSGTSGRVLLRYKISSVQHETVTDIGAIYIDDSATSVTYTTLEGDATSTSLCLTITPLPYACYKVNWKGMIANGYKFNQLILGASTYDLTESNFPDNKNSLAQSINNLNLGSVKVTNYLIVNPLDNFEPENVEYNYIIRVIGTDKPILRVRNADDTGHIYLYGTTTTCSPVGYNSVNICDVIA